MAKKENKKEKEEKSKGVEIKIAPLNIKAITLPLSGKKPLLMDRFPDEAKEQILAKQTGVAKSGKKKVRDTSQETLDAVHTTSSGKIGFPSAGFKRGMMEVTSFVGDKFFSKKLVCGAVKIVNSEDGLIPISYEKQDVLQHSVGHNTKFTPQLHNWSCILKIEYDANNISAQDIVTLLNHAGFYVGVGSWRPKGGGGGSGEYGTYEVKTE